MIAFQDPSGSRLGDSARMSSKKNAAICRSNAAVSTLTLDWVEARVEYELNTGCWLWTGPIDNGGYGRASIAGIAYPAHRLSWNIANAQRMADGLFACHRCDTPTCVNPGHIFPGTPRENSLDCIRKGRRSHHHGHSQSFSDRDVRISRRLVRHGVGPGIIADFLKVKPETLMMAVRGKTYGHIPGALPDAKLGKRFVSRDAIRHFFEEANVQ